jgi:hypothetical protein
MMSIKTFDNVNLNLNVMLSIDAGWGYVSNLRKKSQSHGMYVQAKLSSVPGICISKKQI